MKILENKDHPIYLSPILCPPGSAVFVQCINIMRMWNEVKATHCDACNVATWECLYPAWKRCFKSFTRKFIHAYITKIRSFWKLWQKNSGKYKLMCEKIWCMHLFFLSFWLFAYSCNIFIKKLNQVFLRQK